MTDTDKPFRLLPLLGAENRFFWTSGADGRLRFLRCRDCGHWCHPPYPRCPSCLSPNLAPQPVSGYGFLYTFTANYQAWNPTIQVPYVVGIVELDEQRGLRLTTSIVGCNYDEVEIGMRVEVVFEPHDEIYLPLFQPMGTT